MRASTLLVLLLSAITCLSCPAARAAEAALSHDLVPVGRFDTGVRGASAAEIAAYDPSTRRLFVVDGGPDPLVRVLDLADPARPTLAARVDLSAHGRGVSSVAFGGGVFAVAVPGPALDAPGHVVFLNPDGEAIAAVRVGMHPDMVVFTPDGRTVLTADEGELSADGKVDPPGSVSIVDLARGAARVTQDDVVTLGFDAFNEENTEGVRVARRGASFAEDLEPEYIAVSSDGTRAWVALQENNAIATVDIPGRRIVAVRGLGFKDHALPGMGLDPNDKNGRIAPAPWPVRGLYQPDAIAAFRLGGRDYIVTANEGDVREAEKGSQARRVAALRLCQDAFPDAASLQRDDALGRLHAASDLGDADGDGRHEAIHAYGARSVSVWSDDLERIWDSGDLLERLAAERLDRPGAAPPDAADLIKRGDRSGPEPEGVTVGWVDGVPYAFVGVERSNDVIAFALDGVAEDPPRVRLAAHRHSGGDGDLAPEGLLFIPAEDSPNGAPLLVICHEHSGTVAIYAFRPRA